MFWPVGGAVGQPAAPPDQAWQTAVDQYLAGDRSGAGATLLHATPPALFESSRRAFEQWRAGPAGDAEARRIATRRFQVSALLPLDLLIAVTGRALATEHEVALENAAREAWQRLDAFDGQDGGAASAQVRQFRRWWRLAFVQHLIASGRFRDVPREAASVHPPEDDAEAVAALALLRGVALETRARLADEVPTGSAAVNMRRLPVASRTAPMLIAMDDAGKQYRRALELKPGDREATLRLARVAIERNRLDDAERLLSPLLLQACRDAVCGLAHLFAGEVYEGRKDMERASGSYARASAVPAVRHSALVAMMQAAMRRGSAGGAYDLTRQFATPVALAPRQPPDAWNLYTAGRLFEGDRILTHLMATVVK
ncbi:tetratricopeptide repeat protein [Luteitalea pratensis]|uniref:tetratricopeptide repeat protein n=1 Tax=Luteitalea pratensis TaxID=1855912 RepID=UPI0012FF9C14|nr:tetratricopeptide repeat protein [Luteitalea pratensis]